MFHGKGLHNANCNEVYICTVSGGLCNLVFMFLFVFVPRDSGLGSVAYMYREAARNEAISDKVIRTYVGIS